MENPRIYGQPPVKIVLVHGGPGAAGEMAPVARELSRARGVPEPLQAARTVASQVDELNSHIEGYSALPVVLVGYSCGAWLSCILAAHCPDLVSKLILISCGPLQDRYIQAVQTTRLSRLYDAERKEMAALEPVIEGRTAGDREKAFERLGELPARTDAFDPLPEVEEQVALDMNIFRNVWAEASAMRTSGELLKVATSVKCAVVALHGEHDPHPAEGVQKPLSRVLDQQSYLRAKSTAARACRTVVSNRGSRQS